MLRVYLEAMGALVMPGEVVLADTQVTEEPELAELPKVRMGPVALVVAEVPPRFLEVQEEVLVYWAKVHPGLAGIPPVTCLGGMAQYHQGLMHMVVAHPVRFFRR